MQGMGVLFRLKPLLPDHLLASVHSLIGAEAAVFRQLTVR